MKSRESKNVALSAAKKQMLLQKVGVLNRFYPDFVAKCEALRPFYCDFRLAKWGDLYIDQVIFLIFVKETVISSQKREFFFASPRI